MTVKIYVAGFELTVVFCGNLSKLPSDFVAQAPVKS